MQTWTDPWTELSWSIRIRWTQARGRPQPTGVMIYSEDGVALTADIIRRVQWGQVFTDDVQQQSAAPVVNDVAKAPTPKRGRRLTDADLGVVADVYVQAWERRLHPTKAVADRLGIARSTAAKRVMAARRAGFIPPA